MEHTNILQRGLAIRQGIVSSAALQTPTFHFCFTCCISRRLPHPLFFLRRFHFSFADWYGAGAKQNFGALRVVNDDLVKARAGFGAHPHTNAEIFSYIVDGALSHADSMGNTESLPRGGVQYMSAGTGVVHSEMNNGDETCRFLQIWLTPDARGHKPQYGSMMTTPEMKHNKLLTILQGTGNPPAWAVPIPGEPVKLHQDATVMVSQADAGVKQEVALGVDRQAYLVCIEGSMRITAGGGDPVVLDTREAAEIVAGSSEVLPLMLVAGDEGAHFMLIEMKTGKGSAYEYI